MKNSIRVIASLILIISAQAANAGQYEIYVTSATHVSMQQEELSSLVQKGILVDSAKKTLSLQLSSLCKPGNLCNEAIRSVTLPLTTFKSKDGMPVTLIAQGNLSLNGTDSFTRVEIKLNADNAMEITINNSFGCKSNVSTFIGSPATLPTILL